MMAFTSPNLFGESFSIQL